MKPSRWIAIVVGVAVVVALFLIIRPGGDGSPSGPTGPSGTVTAEIDVTVADGEVTGPGQAEVTQGQPVRITVTADVSDEVHLHGYDLHADVTPDEPGVIAFTADAAGVFEVELEGAGLLLFELTVSP